MRVRTIFCNSGNGSLQVPGIGDFPVNYEQDWEYRCAHGVNDWQEHRLTAREIAMLNVMDALTEKPDWDKKVFNEEIVQKWRSETSNMPLISGKTFEWCLTELRDKVQLYHKTKLIPTLNSLAGCCKSDTLVSPELREQLVDAVRPLIEAEEKDWHPKSNEMVLNLVHPSLFPFVYDRTRILMSGEQVEMKNFFDSCGKGEIAPTPKIVSEERYYDPIDETARWSTRFQWLPCEVRFKGSKGTDIEITSYINNLHPSHKSLYGIIEKLISLSVPAWNEILVKKFPFSGGYPYRIQTAAVEFEEELPEWSNTLPFKGEDGHEEAVNKVKEYLARPNKVGPDFDLEGDWGNGTMDLYEVVHWKYNLVRGVKHPEPGDAYSFEDWKAGRTDGLAVEPRYQSSMSFRPSKHEYHRIRLHEQFRDEGLQVIVKLASIELTPEKPEYEGGNWHLEGMMNEHIAATAIYYYDVDNVAEARISFRQEATMDDKLEYEQGDHGPLSEVFGTDSLTDEPAVQELGSIATPQGRLLAFPNVLQHKVEPFRLVDPTRPGHRRFLVLWLVDPYYRIISTANVPPQRHDWWAPEAFNKLKLHEKLPREVEHMIREGVGDWPMGMEEAKQLRLQLMKERTRLMPEIESHMEEYNFCEH